MVERIRALIACAVEVGVEPGGKTGVWLWSVSWE